ncbi:type II secretion system minor pseudopilin GspK [Cognaticolwellia mytili]|uniref:type II secretion system minor pseudopilin GspK n=1 Tax=Cognaticolwellia mytili TaxID=1888913 RepID=UPI001F17B2A8|nr:type II secretion system minor pseudopilin GspK [Cognaticolwellia mytili]
MAKNNRQKGVALITVMLIVALIAILATQMTARLQLQMQRTTNIGSNQQAYWYAMGAEAFAKGILKQSFEDNAEVTSLEQIWAQGESTLPVDFGEITGEITDLHSCFNLNSLRSDDGSGDKGTVKSIARRAFEELLIALNIEGIGNFEAESMADALADWLDADDSISSSGGAEDNDYAAKEFPYLAANNYLASINELRVVEHFNVTVINKLRDYVCVLPDTNLNKVNINTIAQDKPELLVAMLGITQNVAEEVLSSRKEEGFQSVDELFKLSILKSVKKPEDKKTLFTVKSEYFKFKTNASFNSSYFAMKSIMRVENKNNINVVSRIIGRE